MAGVEGGTVPTGAVGAPRSEEEGVTHMCGKHGGVSRSMTAAFVVALALVIGVGCGSSSSGDPAAASGGPGNDPTTAGLVYPAFADDDSDGINDFVEAASHDPGAALRMMPGMGPGMGPGWPSSPVTPGVSAPPGHPFLDLNGDGICDYAQNGSNTWHGPGFLDEDLNGVCDYWQQGSTAYGMNGGMMFIDRNGNGINDYAEQPSHQGYGHSFVDQNHDGICDYAQSGGIDAWHGPNFADQDHNGMCDWWQQGHPGWWHMGPGGWCPMCGGG